jgi:hypothetical protein
VGGQYYGKYGSFLWLALDANYFRSANDSPKGTNIIVSFKEQGPEGELHSTIFNHHP